MVGRGQKVVRVSILGACVYFLRTLQRLLEMKLYSAKGGPDPGPVRTVISNIDTTFGTEAVLLSCFTFTHVTVTGLRGLHMI